MQGVAKSITLWPSSGPKSHLWKSWARKLFTTITTHGQAGSIQDDTLSTARTRHSAARQLFERISFAKKISVIQDEHRYLPGHDKNKAYITRVRTSLIFFTFQTGGEHTWQRALKCPMFMVLIVVNIFQRFFLFKPLFRPTLSSPRLINTLPQGWSWGSTPSCWLRQLLKPITPRFCVMSPETQMPPPRQRRVWTRTLVGLAWPC